MSDRLLHLLGNGRIAGRGFRHDPDDGVIVMDKDPDDHLILTVDISKLLSQSDEISMIDLLAQNIEVTSHSNNNTRVDLWLGAGPYPKKTADLRLRVSTVGGEQFDQTLRFVGRER